MSWHLLDLLAVSDLGGSSSKAVNTKETGVMYLVSGPAWGQSRSVLGTKDHLRNIPRVGQEARSGK